MLRLNKYRVQCFISNIDCFQQKCCGGAGPYDYYNSFWYITNTDRGTRSFVPQSCCKQAQSGRAWAVVPVDPMCTTYFYYTNAFNTSVNIEVSEWK